MAPSSDRLERLARAVDAWLARSDARSQAAKEEFLRGHEDLRDLLEPMLEDLAAAPDAAAEGEPHVLGDFRLIRELGRGGMGVVYEAHQISLDRRVAIKVLPHELTLRPGSVARFKREALTAGRLRHPGIVEILTVGSEGDTHFFAMELIEGHTPQEWIALPEQGDGRLPARRAQIAAAVELCAQVADALEHAHQSGVVHRDVKPTNILVRRDGRAVLTDFGLAWEENLPSLTAPGSLAGTPHYVSPEQVLRRREPVDHRTDIFSLGASLYELLTRRPPFDAESTMEILRRIVEAEPVDPRLLEPQIEPDLAAVVMRALEKTPGRRYPTAAAFAADLRAFLEHRPVVARRPTALGRVVRWARRTPLKAGMVATVALSALLVAGLLGFMASQWPVLQAGRDRLAAEEAERALAQADLELDVNRLEAAMVHARRAFDLRPGDPEVMATLVHCLGRMGQGDEALAFLEAKDRHLTGSTRDWLHAFALVAAGRQEAAAEARARLPAPSLPLEHYLCGLLVLDGSTGSRPASLALRHLRRAALASPVARRLYHCRWAATAARAADADEIRDCVAALESLWPDSPQIAFWIGFAWSPVEPARAAAAFRRALAGGFDGTSIRTNLANALDRAGDFAGARREYERALALDPQNPVAAQGLGVLLLNHGEPDAALKQLEAALLLEPRSARAHGNLGAALQARGRMAEAEAAYARAAELEPDYAWAHFNLGVNLARRGALEQALPHLRQAVALAPDWGAAHGNLGIALLQGGDARQALGPLLHSVTLEPQNGLVRGVLDTCVAALDPPAARTELEAWTAAHQGSAEGWRQLALLLLDEHAGAPDPKRALVAAQTAVELSGGRDTACQAARAEALLANDRAAEAAQAAAQSLERLKAESRPAPGTESALRSVLRRARQAGR